MFHQSRDDVLAAYTGRLQEYEAARDAAHARSRRVSGYRIATFLAIVGALVAADVLTGDAETVAFAVAGALAGVFIGQVAVHRRIRRAERWQDVLASIAREGLLRFDRDWEGLEEALPPAERTPLPLPPDHAYARDLDVAGRASLERLMGPVTSERGRELLRSWLLAPADEPVVRARRGAVAELAGRVHVREAVTAHGRIDQPDRLEGVETFLEWAEGDPWLAERTAVRWAAWLLPPVLIGLILLDLFGGWGPWWILPALAQLEIFRRTTPRASTDFSRAARGAASLAAWAPQLARLSAQSWTDPLLVALGERLGEGDGAAHRKLIRLRRRLDTIESRRNIIYASLAPILLLDVHLTAALDRWRAAHGEEVRGWLESLGTWEALSALATLAHDHPSWVFPDVGAPEDERILRARSVGHPLLHPERCVRNDVELGPPGTFLLVTGSNMSGKSTLLRALGTNAVLAAAGAPVCAEALELPPVRVHTSMRIDDSLEEGVSRFMAELLRVRGIVDAATEDGRPVLYLLDEMLHGTNTAERRIAARGVLRHLLDSGAIGAVSTHDLTLADAPDLRERAVAVHFRETVERDEDGTHLDFDYTLRPGIATTRNALTLLEAVGLGGLDLDGEAEAPEAPRTDPTEGAGEPDAPPEVAGAPGDDREAEDRAAG